MNRYPFWKYLLIATIAGLGILYSLPNLYPPDPAIQISGQRSNMVMDQSILDKASAALTEAGIASFGGEVGERNVLLRLEQESEQLAARDVVKTALGDEFIAALNRASTTPDWLASLGGKPMKLGLDLSGGIHFLLQVDTSDRMEQELNNQIDSLKKQLREDNIRGVRLAIDDTGAITASCRDKDTRKQLKQLVRSQFSALSFPDKKVETEQDELFLLHMLASEQWAKDKVSSWVQQNLQSLRKRVNELGVSEPIVQRQGKDRIMVQLPGIQDTAEAERIINKTATLEFRLEAREGGQTFPFKSEPGRTAKLERRAITTGEAVTDATFGLDQQNGGPMVSIKLNSDGGAAMGSTTLKNVGHPMAILFVEKHSKIVKSRDADGNEVDRIETTESKEIISLATIQGVFGKSFQITGLDSVAEAQELALLLRAGALAAPMVIVTSRTIGPSLGADNIKLGVTSVQLGMALVLLFMLVYYKAFGVMANVALAMNIVILAACMSLFNAILTLPGIAGIVLTVGMAVDANVLIFSRIKEELKNGLQPQQAISAGYDRAFVSILDANITTLIVALILFLIGSGPVKGFAVTLSIGIITSMFTSIMGTRALVNLVYGGRKKLQKLWI